MEQKQIRLGHIKLSLFQFVQINLNYFKLEQNKLDHLKVNQI